MWRHEQADGDPLRARDRQPQDDDERGYYARNDQMDRALAPLAFAGPRGGEERPVAAQMQASRSGGDRNWSARIRASISRLLEIDGISLDSDMYGNPAEKWKARAAEQTFHARVDRLQAASESAHKDYWDRLRDVYSASTAKRMRLSTTMTTDSLPASAATSAWQPRHEALDALAVAAATEQCNGPRVPPIEITASKKSKRGDRRHNALPMAKDAETARNSVAVQDPALVKAVDKLTGKLTELLGQLQATSDAAAAEPILAAAATIALEATEMRRCEEVALTRMMEIEEHRQHIMQGLLEYTQRKEKREMHDKGIDEGAGRDSSSAPALEAIAEAEDVDDEQTEGTRSGKCM